MISNGTHKVDSGTWGQEELNITYSQQSNVLGFIQYNLTVNVNFDIHPTSSLVNLTVSDTTKPTISLSATATNFTVGTISQFLQWSIVDFDPNNLTLFRNNTVIKQKKWTSGTKYTHSLSNLGVGTYNFWINATDGSGNFNSENITISVTGDIISTTSSTTNELIANVPFLITSNILLLILAIIASAIIMIYICKRLFQKRKA